MRNVLLLAAVTLVSCTREQDYDAYAAGVSAEVPAWVNVSKKQLAASDPVVRGSLLRVSAGKTFKQDGVTYLGAVSGGRKIWVPESAIAATPREAVQ